MTALAQSSAGAAVGAVIAAGAVAAGGAGKGGGAAVAWSAAEFARRAAARRAVVFKYGDGGLMFDPGVAGSIAARVAGGRVLEVGESTPGAKQIQSLRRLKRRARARRAAERAEGNSGTGRADSRANDRFILTAWPPEEFERSNRVLAETRRNAGGRAPCNPRSMRMQEIRRGEAAGPAARKEESVPAAPVENVAETHLDRARRRVAALDVVYPTRDQSDRAHLVRREETTPEGVQPMLVPGIVLGPEGGGVRVRSRRYPASQLTSRGVAFDSAFDELHEMQRSLAGIPGIGRGENARASSAPLTVAELLAAAASLARARGRAGGVRSVIEKRVDGRARLRSAEDVIRAYRRGTWNPEL